MVRGWESRRGGEGGGEEEGGAALSVTGLLLQPKYSCTIVQLYEIRASAGLLLHLLLLCLFLLRRLSAQRISSLPAEASKGPLQP